MVNTERAISAKRDIDTFTDYFFKTYNIVPIITYHTNKGSIEDLPISEVEQIVNNILLGYTGNNTIVLTTKSRIKILNVHRQCTFKILYDMGYTLHRIGKYFGFNHATVLHARDTVNDYILLKDPMITDTLNKIIYEIKQNQDRSKSVIPPVKPEFLNP